MSPINYDSCLLKHYVRNHGWLPLCQERLAIVRQAQSDRNQRRIYYFTFCAIGAVDVLMLDIARIVTRSASGRFDNVVYFDRTVEDVEKTQKAIPGAVGYPADFFSTVLLDNCEEYDAGGASDPLESIADREDTAGTRRTQQLKALRRSYIGQFPFDILNFDLEEFFFKPNDPIPGKIVKALCQIFEWQKKLGKDRQGKARTIDSFSLMFTTQVGPSNLTADYLDQLEGCLRSNIDGNQSLREAFLARVGHDDVGGLRSNNFELFFKLGMPKVLAAILEETDWMVDSDKGITVYEFSRPSSNGPYKMLHLMMQVKRQPPHLPGSITGSVNEAHANVIKKLFQEEHVLVTEALIETVRPVLQMSLANVLARRQKYLTAEY